MDSALYTQVNCYLLLKAIYTDTCASGLVGPWVQCFHIISIAHPAICYPVIHVLLCWKVYKTQVFLVHIQSPILNSSERCYVLPAQTLHPPPFTNEPCLGQTSPSGMQSVSRWVGVERQ